MAERAARNDRNAPISVYEVHLGSWRRNLAEHGSYLTYRELAECGIQLWIDAGLADVERADQFVAFAREYPQVTGIVAGLESLSG